MNISSFHISKVLFGFLLTLSVILGGMSTPCLSASTPSPVRLRGHVPTKALATAKMLGRLASNAQISMAFVLPLRNQAELQKLLERIYDPADPLYGHYLKSQEFTDSFSPTQTDYDAVISYAQSQGLTVSGTHPNRLLLNVSAPAGVIESAFNLHFQRYQAPEGREFYTPDDDPEVPYSTASRIVGVVGLDNASVWRAHSRFVPAAELTQNSPNQIGTGPGGGLTPNDVLAAYNLQGVAAKGTGQILGLFELDGYKSSDVASYVGFYSLPSVPLQNVLIDGFSGNAGSGASEVTLDIELQIALAPGASKIIVYEGPNSNTGVVDTYNRIATDNLAKQISTSWGLSEGQSGSAVISSENAIFQQMAAQGQTIYAASGDSGAYDNGSTISVDDPASQPYMVGVGGTQLFINSNETYNYETTWNVNNTVSGGAGGGGVSSLWSIPAWQQGVASAVSTTMRNVPDVSLNADQYTGYSIYYNGGWTVYGGTSCAAPIWAAFTARINQQRSANGDPPLGFANPAIYKIAKGLRYGADFHDTTQGTNIYYAAVPGYDNATGWGSFNGANLLSDLAPIKTYTLTYTAGVNGSVSGTTPQTVSSGGSGTPVTAVANSGYHFVSWSDGITSATRTDTNVTANISVASSFVSDPYAQILGFPQIYYGLLQLACNAADNNAVIQVQGITFPENLTIGKSTAVTLDGGWDPAFSTRNGNTVLQGTLTISQGKLVVDHFIIQAW
jgi:kumamolisin